MFGNIFQKWKEHANHWKGEIIFLIAILRHPDVPRGSKFLVFTLLSYIFSPLDLIPDFIPIFGHWDDLFMIPLTMKFVNKRTPPEVLQQVRDDIASGEHPVFKGWGPKVAALTVLILWLLVFRWTLMLLGIEGHGIL